MSQLYELTPDAIFVVGSDGRILSMNPRASALFGYGIRELLGRTIEVLVPEDLRARHASIRAAYLREPHERRMGTGFDVWAERKDGQRFPVEIALLPLTSAAEVRVLALVRDVSERHTVHVANEEQQAELEQRVEDRTAELTQANLRLQAEVRERERAEQELRSEQQRTLHAERMSSIGLLSSGLAHEINNPLSGLLGCIKALREGQLSPARQRQYLDTIDDGLNRIAGTVRGLLDYARQRTPAPEPVELADVVGATLRLVEPLATKRQVELVFMDPSPPGCVFADRAQLMQAILNVLMNAVQATDRAGVVRLEVQRAGSRLGLRVSDTGPGFAEEHLHRACDPFFTTKPEGEGTGLGLAVTQGIIHAHGGELEVRNQATGGAEITMWLGACCP